MTKKQIIKYLKANELDIQRAHAFLFFCDLAYSAYANSKSVHGTDFFPIFCYLSYTDHEPHYQLISKKKIDEIAEKAWKDYQRDKSSLNKKISFHELLLKDFDKIWDEFESGGAKKAETGFYLKIFKKFIKLSTIWWKYASIGENKGHIVETVIVPRFAKRHKLSMDKAREIVHALSHPREKSVFSEERKDFYNLAMKYAKKKKIDRELEKYVKEYFWIKTDFCYAKIVDKDAVIKDMRTELKKHPLMEIKEELQKIIINEKKLAAEKKKYLKTAKISRADKDDLYFAERMIFWTDRRKKGMLYHMYYLWNFLAKMAKNFDAGYKELNMLTVKELEKFLKTGRLSNKKESVLRKNGFFLNFEKDKDVKLIYGKDGREILAAGAEMKEKNIKGMVASKGKGGRVIGRANIIMNIKRDKFNKGGILVTSMTRPEFVPLMRLAKAVITDEGGIACHAAIVSRELGKPCIIGTKNATRAIKDGDMVELNTENGSVKIIN